MRKKQKETAYSEEKMAVSFLCISLLSQKNNLVCF